MRHPRLLAITLVLTTTVTALAQRPSTALAPDRLSRIDDLLQRYVDENRIAGAVALVLRDGKPAYERAIGWSDKEAGRRMTIDTIFRIASQTKAITSAAVLSLVEDGRLGLTTPASDFIPSFANTMVAVDASGTVPASGASRSSISSRIPPASPTARTRT